MILDVDALVVAKRQLLDDGFCVVDGNIGINFLDELCGWSSGLLDESQLLSDWKYQGSDIHISGARFRSKRDNGLPRSEIVDRLIEHPMDMLRVMGLGDFKSGGTFQIISKPAEAPALYWHQDWARWDDPMSLSPWPQQIFLNWYLDETDTVNGCWRVIPGTHRRRVDLHDHLVPPHEGGGYQVEESNEWMFFDHPEAIDVTVSPGDLVIADARILHGTHPNQSAKRRTLLLGWYYRKSNEVPINWNEEVPDEILNRPPDLPFRWNRVPGKYLF